MDQVDATGLQEFIPACATWFPLDRYKALAYFEQSSFFSAAGRDANGQPLTVNNTEARLAGLDPAHPGVLESLPHGRPEFVLETTQEPHAFVIRKQAPSAHQVTHARLLRCTFALQQGFARLQADLEPITRRAKRIAGQEGKEPSPPQKLQKLAPQGGGQGAGAGTGAGAEALGEGGSLAAAAAGVGPAGGQASRGDGTAAAAAAAAGLSYTVQPYAASVDLESPSLGTLRAPLAAPLPEVMAAAAASAAAAGPGGGGGAVPVRRHLTDADRARWSKLDRILSHQFSSLQRIKYSALPPDYLQKLNQQMYNTPVSPGGSRPATAGAGPAEGGPPPGGGGAPGATNAGVAAAAQ
ncbi:hypothetical protein TSOC_004354 [Tetrabaena socialis]|uniref:Mediator of RNA polymerase II transcription subunit 6 n=1 Tax=Tetrabaena socialis TaxID=47790 RepID=A0A2J8A922_9CHLO|nr:hypothetical protein TSOC_004354 [Tetrabaena socialis]|eukprot:PNH09032.1 hypothetical protein TSOC_004354 [Tetrabaena socialis]